METDVNPQDMAPKVARAPTNESENVLEMSGSTRGTPSSRGDSAAALNPKSPGLLERVQARGRSDQYREEIVRSIFGEVGTPVEGKCISHCYSLAVPCRIENSAYQLRSNSQRWSLVGLLPLFLRAILEAVMVDGVRRRM